MGLLSLMLFLSLVLRGTQSFHLYRCVVQRKPSLHLTEEPHKKTYRRSVCLHAKAWWDDDLPNILGINPIEAAVLFGTLYYFYGPQVLYDYAKEAGKVVSTYAPVIRDVSMNLYHEFRDYFEEDKERDEMRKAGFDIDDIPRRTSTVVQRVQSAYQTLTEVQSAESTSLLQGSLSIGEQANLPLMVPPRRELGSRPSKREVYVANNIDMLEGEEQQPESIDVVLQESIESVKQTFTALKQRAAESSSYDNSPPNPSLYPFPSAADNAPMRTAPALPATAPLVPNKFYQQLTGEWNQRILDTDPGRDFPPPESSWLDPMAAEDGQPKVDGGASSSLRNDAHRDVPSEVSAEGCIDVHFTSTPTTAAPTVTSAQKTAQDLLHEIDADYAKLRQKLLRVIENSS